MKTFKEKYGMTKEEQDSFNLSHLLEGRHESEKIEIRELFNKDRKAFYKKYYDNNLDWD